MNVRVLRNRHGSGAKALAHWQAHGLWGHPIRLGPDKWHVYGVSRRTWRPLNVEFAAQQIVVIRPLVAPTQVRPQEMPNEKERQ